MLKREFVNLTDEDRELLRKQCRIGRHRMEVCKCDREVYHIGQDESVYKSHAHPKKSSHFSEGRKTVLPSYSHNMQTVLSYSLDADGVLNFDVLNRQPAPQTKPI